MIGGRQTGGLQSACVPQGLCENLINARKLLANQQKDGDGPFQSIIVTAICERSRKGITVSLRNITRVWTNNVPWKWVT